MTPGWRNNNPTMSRSTIGTITLETLCRTLLVLEPTAVADVIPRRE
jgi:hypothetical protein